MQNKIIRHRTDMEKNTNRMDNIKAAPPHNVKKVGPAFFAKPTFCSKRHCGTTYFNVTAKGVFN